MAFSNDIFPSDECCEICGVPLDAEVVIQEFADGSLVRLCSECAAGTAFDSEPEDQPTETILPNDKFTDGGFTENNDFDEDEYADQVTAEFPTPVSVAEPDRASAPEPTQDPDITSEHALIWDPVYTSKADASPALSNDSDSNPALDTDPKLDITKDKGQALNFDQVPTQTPSIDSDSSLEFDIDLDTDLDSTLAHELNTNLTSTSASTSTLDIDIDTDLAQDSFLDSCPDLSQDPTLTINFKPTSDSDFDHVADPVPTFDEDLTQASETALTPDNNSDPELDSAQAFDLTPDHTSGLAPALAPELVSTSTFPSTPSVNAMDPLEMTKELMTPISDLIGLQTDMQAALERLATSLERFTAELVAGSQGKAVDVEERLKILEGELEKTRTKLNETESLLITTPRVASEEDMSFAPTETAHFDDTTTNLASSPTPELFEDSTSEAFAIADTAANLDVSPFEGTSDNETAVPLAFFEIEAKEKQSDFFHMAPNTKDSTDEADVTANLSVTELSETSAFEDPPTSDTEVKIPETETQVTETPEAQTTTEVDDIPPSISTPATSTESQSVDNPEEIFSLNEIQQIQKLFNESDFTERIRAVRRSLGKPKANLSRIHGNGSRVMITIFWDIVWYQYMLNLDDSFADDEKITLFKEGMDLEELVPSFLEKNASIDDNGRLDASELEVSLLSDPSVLITEMDPLEEKALEDATEEIWHHQISPEFKWED